jgi:hypothetical protein
MMARFGNNKSLWIVVALVVLLSTPAQSRMWSKNSVSLAEDYAVITDNRGGGEMVLIFWIAPPIIPKGPSSQTAQDMLYKYVLLGVAHAHVAKDATMTFDPIATPGPRDGNGQPLNFLNENALPPTVVGTLAVFKSAFGRSLGALGQGIQWFAFDSGSVNACKKGGMSVPFAGETYTYHTPIPGCP